MQQSCSDGNLTALGCAEQADCLAILLTLNAASDPGGPDDWAEGLQRPLALMQWGEVSERCRRARVCTQLCSTMHSAMCRHCKADIFLAGLRAAQPAWGQEE